MTRRFWSDEDEAKLARLIRNGEPVLSIALEMDRTMASVIARAQMLGLRLIPGQRGPRHVGQVARRSGFSRLFE